MPEAFSVPGNGISALLRQGIKGEVVLVILRTLDNEDAGRLRLSRRGKKMA
jgi:ribosomal protein S28E/S33